MHDVLTFDAELGKTLQELHVLVCRKQYLESSSSASRDAISDLRFRGTTIERLYLDFTPPGYPDYILKPGDENVTQLMYKAYVLHVISPLPHPLLLLVKICLMYSCF